MTEHHYLSMSKAIAYVGDAQSAHQLLGTLNSSLISDDAKIASAIELGQFDVLQKIWHQLKGFAPVFCQDSLVEEIAHTELLCKQIQLHDERAAALLASANLRSNLKALQAEAAAQILAAGATTTPPKPLGREQA
jgi:HPt (histidine-containing phosphotransfer) domain-containing protein